VEVCSAPIVNTKSAFGLQAPYLMSKAWYWETSTTFFGPWHGMPKSPKLSTLMLSALLPQALERKRRGAGSRMRRVLARRGLRILAAFTIGRRCEEVIQRAELGLLCEPPRQEHKPKIKARRRKRGKGKKVRDVKPPKKKKTSEDLSLCLLDFHP